MIAESSNSYAIDLDVYIGRAADRMSVNMGLGKVLS